MMVKINLTDDISEWLRSVSETECRSNAGQVLFFLKQIKQGQIGPVGTQKGTECVTVEHHGTDLERQGTNETQEGTESSKEEQDNLDTMLGFM